MQKKVKITLVVPERIAVLVQSFIENNISGQDDSLDWFLNCNDIDNPRILASKIIIGIKYDDDEPVKIKDFLAQEYKEVLEYLQEYIEPTYSDNELGEHLYSVDCLSEGIFYPPIEVVEFHESVKATDCSYFRFVN